jgi:uncharacterized membrane protein
MEARLQSLEDRVQALEAMLVAQSAETARAARPAQAGPAPDRAVLHAPPRRAAPPVAIPVSAPSKPFDLEELLGGRILAWLGGIAVFVAAIFFLVMAIRNGWIDEATRVCLAFAGSTVLFLVGLWLYERKGQTDAAIATVAASIAALYAADTTATAVYGLVSPVAGLVLAGLIGVAATAIAVRWDSIVVAAIGIVGALLAPVLVDAGASSASLAFMVVALCSAIAVLIWRRWSWLAAAAYVTSLPQAIDWIEGRHDDHLALCLAVSGVFWALYVVAALGYELRVPTAKLRLSSASLLFTNTAVTSALGWWLLHDAGRHAGATAWVLAVAAANALLGLASLRGGISREVGALLAAVAAALAGVGVALALDGPALVAAWSAEAVLLAWVARRSGDRRGYLGTAIFLGLAAAHTLAFEARPDALAYRLDSVPSAVVAVALVVATLGLVWRLIFGEKRKDLAPDVAAAAAVAAVYLASLLVVTLAGAHPHGTTQTSQLALSAFWAMLGFGALVGGLVRDLKPLRLGGLGLLGLAVGKVFIVDLARLDSIWRVGSFLGLGLLLLAGAFAYQRVRVAERA